MPKLESKALPEKKAEPPKPAEQTPLIEEKPSPVGVPVYLTVPTMLYREPLREGEEACPVCGGKIQNGSCSCGKTVQRDHTGPAPSRIGPTVNSALTGSHQQSLDSGSRSFFESRFGRDLGSVRVHTGPASEEAADTVRARAFTVGESIVFGAGQYSPHSDPGRRLLAHELTHVIQQRSAPAGIPSQVSSPSDPAEEEARRLSQQLLAGAFVNVVASPSGALHRDDNSPAPATGVTGSTLAVPPPVIGNQPNQSLAGPPVIPALDTSVDPPRIFFSVSIPGQYLSAISTWMYGSPDSAGDISAANGGLPEFVPAGRSIKMAEGKKLSEGAASIIKEMLDGGTILRSKGMQDQGGEQVGVQLTIGGRTIVFTRLQYKAFLAGLAVSLSRKAKYISGVAEEWLKTRDEHEQRYPGIRQVADFFGGVDLPPRFNWTNPKSIADGIMTDMSTGEPTMELIGRDGQRLKVAQERLNDADRDWKKYISGTIAGGEIAIEVTKDVAFALIAAAVGAFVAPIAFAAITGEALTAGAVVASPGAALTSVGLAGGAGGLTRGSLELGNAAIGAQPGQQVDYGMAFAQGYYKGFGAGALGGAGALAAPGVSASVGSKFFGTTAVSTLGMGQRVAVGAATGVIIGLPSGAAGAAFENAPAVLAGKMSGEKYANSILWGGLFGAGTGAVLGGLSGLKAPKPSTAMTTAPPENLECPGGPAPSTGGAGGAAAPKGAWQTTLLTADAEAMEISVMGSNSATGEVGVMRLNVRNGNGTIDWVAGENAGARFIIEGGDVRPAPLALPPGPNAPAALPAGPDAPFALPAGPDAPFQLPGGPPAPQALPQPTGFPFVQTAPPAPRGLSYAAGQRLIGTLGSSRIPTPTPGQAIGVFTLQMPDGSIRYLVGFSGRGVRQPGGQAPRMTGLYDQLQPNLPSDFDLVPRSMITTPPGHPQIPGMKDVPPGTPYPWLPAARPQGMPARPTCALPWVASGYRSLYGPVPGQPLAPQPVLIDMIEVWWGTEPSPFGVPTITYPGGPYPNPSTMISCPSCLYNIGPIMSGIPRK